jgi:hypothetical protein
VKEVVMLTKGTVQTLRALLDADGNIAAVAEGTSRVPAAGARSSATEIAKVALRIRTLAERIRADLRQLAEHCVIFEDLLAGATADTDIGRYLQDKSKPVYGRRN